ncbi:MULTISPECIES: LuxR C-terminal-related transcriptional regulator [Aeromonas]|jgi:DNA-binding NarL/FixJ family response regulator|uniref:Helix-turn-helix transcriptional regulator n=1 Tax=Aeromonas popoffii TaxID=70856 RepID=A0ABS5GTF0_9GAMM|nr:MULTISPECIES: LuxR C-terminal-related transcriptional regulator [Aeromonas]MBR7630102.1 helix-turn-helix transcriptional regulator [Aeromonas popoffii]MDF2415269.1 helix-turn-helix transcriptional regulator [Aeromonas sp. 1HA1]
MFKDVIFMTTLYPIVLVTENNVQAVSFQSYLTEQLALPILLVSILETLPLQDELEPRPLFLVDLDYLKSSQQSGWPREIASRFGEANTVLLNAPTSTDRELLLMWPHTSGLFFRQDPLDRLVLGIRKVLQGEYWIPRHLLCDLVNYYRKGGEHHVRNQTLLTVREQEIIRYLMTGASNTEIADSLFVSEHTIKSHLYNVFKKLNVKNRLQAVSWAKEYL